jgi:hypothetical protein
MATVIKSTDTLVRALAKHNQRKILARYRESFLLPGGLSRVYIAGATHVLDSIHFTDISTELRSCDSRPGGGRRTL